MCGEIFIVSFLRNFCSTSTPIGVYGNELLLNVGLSIIFSIQTNVLI